MTSIETLRAKQRRGEDLTKAEFNRLNKWWSDQRRNPVTPQQERPASYRASSLGFDIQVAEGLKCFKCGTPLQEVTATFGKIPKFNKSEELDLQTGQVEETMFITQQRVASCADCSLHLKPTRDKNHSLDFKTYD